MKKLLSILFIVSISLIFPNRNFAQQGEWTWMQGCNNTGCSVIWGTQGVPDPDNTPGGLYAPYYWVDAQKNLWIFGGISDGYYSAMWKFDPATVEWTWMSGSSSSFQSPVYGSLGVFNSTYTPGYRAFGSVSWIDNDGKFWLWGGDGSFGTMSDLWQYDPTILQWALMNGTVAGYVSPNYGTLGVPSATNTPGSRREGNATWVDSLGNLYMYGGADANGSFHNDIWKYDVSLSEWVWMAGSNLTNQSATYGTQGVADPLNKPSGRSSYCKWQDANGKFWMFGGGDYNTEIYYADLWMFDPSTNYFTWMSGSNTAGTSANAGSECDSSVSYYPAARFEDRSCATDACGNFWMWGGIHSTGTDQSVNDLWVYRPPQNDWTFADGSLTYNQSGVYGTQGQSGPSNVPGSRIGSIMWFDSTGNLWMFGGSSSWYLNYLNDVWRYVPDPDCPSIGNCSSSIAALFVADDTTVCQKFCVNFFDSSQNNPVAWQWYFEGASPASSTNQNPQNICFDSPGTFDVTLITTDAGGEYDTLMLPDYITVYATPAFPTIAQNGYLLLASYADTYQWQLNAVDIPGATEQVYEVSQSGMYTVIAYDVNGCKNSSSLYVQLVGITEVNDNFFVNVFGNPSAGEIIVAGNLTGSEKLKIQLFNDLGQELLETERTVTSDFREAIDARNFPSGIYFVKLTSGSLHANRKIILSK